MIMSMKLRHLYVHCLGLENRMPKQAHSFLKAKHDLERVPPTHGTLELISQGKTIKLRYSFTNGQCNDETFGWQKCTDGQ